LPATSLNALLSRWLRFPRFKASHSSDVHAAASPVRILAITSDDRFYASLLDVGASRGWEVRRGSTIQEGLDTVRSLHMPLVILDWDESAHDWRHGLERIWAAPNHPCVLLASRVMDDNLRQEVQRHHGYDVLPRTGDRDQIVRTVEFAWFWTTHKYASI
jgi:DNA-binding response OmpR family regulator